MESFPSKYQIKQLVKVIQIICFCSWRFLRTPNEMYTKKFEHRAASYLDSALLLQKFIKTAIPIWSFRRQFSVSDSEIIFGADYR